MTQLVADSIAAEHKGGAVSSMQPLTEAALRIGLSSVTTPHMFLVAEVHGKHRRCQHAGEAQTRIAVKATKAGGELLKPTNHTLSSRTHLLLRGGEGPSVPALPLRPLEVGHATTTWPDSLALASAHGSSCHSAVRRRGPHSSLSVSRFD